VILLSDDNEMSSIGQLWCHRGRSKVARLAPHRHILASYGCAAREHIISSYLLLRITISRSSVGLIFLGKGAPR